MNILYLIYSLNVGKKNIFSKILRKICLEIYNYFAPYYYRSCKNNLDNINNDIIISLTTFPARINKTWLVIESLLAQDYQPSKIVLTLSLKQFDGEKDLPKKLLDQRKRGLEILWTEDDLRSHKKYFYVMQKYPNHRIVTVDDDFYYSKGMLKNLVENSKIYPECVISNLAALKIGNNYKEWENLLFKKFGPSSEIMQYGGSGVLYPPRILHVDAFNKEKIKELCPLADDIWLNYMTILNGNKIYKTDYKYYLMPLKIKNNQALKNINVGEDMNSVQIRQLNNKYLK